MPRAAATQYRIACGPRRLTLSLAGLCLLACACITPDPRRFFPLAPVLRGVDDTGATLRGFDVDDDGRVDYREHLDPRGFAAKVAIDLDGDGTCELTLDRRRSLPQRRHLLVILDSIPYELVAQAWQHGRLRLFHPPQRTLAPFPVMTDPALAEFFGVSPCPGVESMYYDGRKLIGGLGVYLSQNNAPWMAQIDIAAPQLDHGPAYLYPGVWLDRELTAIQQRVLQRREPRLTAYVVSTSGIGAKFGRDGHVAALVRLDCLSQALLHALRGEIEITLMSDHGHNLLPSKRALLARHLWRCGWNVTDRLRGPRDVISPEFGPVSCAAVYTRSPEAVAQDLVLTEPVELCLLRDASQGLLVLSREGRARIARCCGGFTYQPEWGDPLKLAAILEGLRARGAVASDGCIDDAALFDATLTHDFPDPLQRAWRAFDGLFQNTPDVLVSLHEGWFVGSADFEQWIDMSAVHGNLRPRGSFGFVMSTVAAFERPLRIADLAAELQKLGVPLQRSAP